MSEEKMNVVRMVKMTEVDFNYMVDEISKLPAKIVGGLLFQWLPQRTFIFEEAVPVVEEKLPENTLPFKKPEDKKEE